MSRRTGLLFAGLLLAVLVVAVLVGLSDLGRLRERWEHVDWRWAAVASACAVLSYACIAATQHALFALLGFDVPRWFAMRVSMVSVVVARTLRSAGTSGLAFLSIAFSRRGVPVVATLSMGIGNVMLNACVAMAFVLAGIVMLLVDPRGAGRAAGIGYAAGATLLIAGILGAWMLLTRERWRRHALARLSRIANAIGRRVHRPDWGDRLHDAGERASGAAGNLFRRPLRAWRAWAWAVLRLVTSLASLGACARAVGLDVSAPELVLAFTAMKMAGSLAFVPAGLGIVDGSLAGMLTLLGAPYESALLVAALHRVAYHVVPAAVSLAIAGPLLAELLGKEAHGPKSGL